MYDESRNYVLSATHAAAYQITGDICVLCYDSIIALAVHRGLELKNGCCKQIVLYRCCVFRNCSVISRKIVPSAITFTCQGKARGNRKGRRAS